VVLISDNDVLLRVLKHLEGTFALGNPMAPILCGFGDDGCLAMQRYVDESSDVQFASCLFAPYYSKKHALWSAWNRTYTNLLNERGLFHERAKHDASVRQCQMDHAAMMLKFNIAMPSSGKSGAVQQSTSSIGSVTTLTANPARYVEVRCSCGQALHDGALLKHNACMTSSASFGSATCGSGRSSNTSGHSASTALQVRFAAACPNELCKNGSHPCCSVCLRKLNGKGVVTAPRHWFAWCTMCLHGGHWDHLEQWFAKHKKCPADDCFCECYGIAHGV
jgi:hypothetical protein